MRDALLDHPVKDPDWVVVGARPEELLSQGFTQVWKDFPVFLHPQTKDEYALARTERKKGHGYTGFSVDYDPGVTLDVVIAVVGVWAVAAGLTYIALSLELRRLPAAIERRMGN